MRASRTMLGPIVLLAAGLLLPAVARADAAKCLAASGKAGARCLERYAGAVAKCRRKADAGCEAALRADGGALDQLLAAGEAKIRKRCREEDALPLGYLTLDDIVAKGAAFCADFAEDHLAFAFGGSLESLDSNGLACQKVVAKQLAGVRKHAIREYGPGCFRRSFEGKACKRERRDARLAKRSRKAAAKIEKRCGAGFDALGLPVPEGGELRERIDALVSRAAERAHHFALSVYPPNDLGPTADFGPYPVGVRTLELADPSRPDVGEPAEPRPVTVEIYYPSTDAAVAGLPRDVVGVLGIDLVETPSYRDAAIAAGPFPLILFSHGNSGIRFQSFFFTAHLASHGYVVVTPDHHGNTFVDVLAEVVDEDSVINRPLDMSFLIDEIEERTSQPGDFLEGAVDTERIGMSGHSFGGYTSFVLAGPAFEIGEETVAFTDPRIDAILPQAPGVPPFIGEDFFAGIGIPTLIVGGSLDETTPFESQQQAPFDALPSGAAFVGVAELAGAGHFTFSDFCEVPRELLSFLGGFEEACEPRHLPWRHAHDLVNYLSLNFFDAILKDDAEALARLSPAALAGIEGLRVETK